MNEVATCSYELQFCEDGFIGTLCTECNIDFSFVSMNTVNKHKFCPGCGKLIISFYWDKSKKK